MADRDVFTPKPNLKQGKYQHYKGNNYEVIDLVCHSETHEWLVLYRRLYEREGPELWVRPYDMFVEEVEIEGKTLPRFRFIDKNL
jgi:hypothetical protein